MKNLSQVLFMNKNLFTIKKLILLFFFRTSIIKLWEWTKRCILKWKTRNTCILLAHWAFTGSKLTAPKNRWHLMSFVSLSGRWK